MTIAFTEHDRKLILKHFRAVAKEKNSEDLVTVLHITEIYVEQKEE